MRVLVDTSVWSLALRRSALRADERDIVLALRGLISDGRATMIGAVRQELLSGIRDVGQFESLARHLAAFRDLDLAEDDHVLAARFFNACLADGIQGSNTDLLICAAASARGMPIFTTDQDFEAYSDILPIGLYRPGQEPQGLSEPVAPRYAVA